MTALEIGQQFRELPPEKKDVVFGFVMGYLEGTKGKLSPENILLIISRAIDSMNKGAPKK